ncbi:MAG: 50S ribosomal protein L9 [Halobacteriovoraceae bacterium]|jgi:large subunit ribosomal protein L9|nr:50S ribosomal protein L9 [Halobacteriovoraceae bacterium]MBT5093091.1 50S ribosomal protein L9 [Halobacteriovoraceae bacterium]
MKVILTEKVTALGNVGEVVNVSSGYARNFLIPNRYAVLADDGNKKQLEHHKKALAKKVEGEKSIATDLQASLNGKVYEFIKKVGASGKLFGTVTSNEISKRLKEEGLDVERRLLIIEVPIKSVGTYSIKAKLFPEVEAVFEVKVAMDPKQAEEMKALANKKAKDKKEAAEKAEAAKAEGADAEEKSPSEEAERSLDDEAAKILRSF